MVLIPREKEKWHLENAKKTQKRFSQAGESHSSGLNELIHVLIWGVHFNTLLFNSCNQDGEKLNCSIL